ncbi:MAG TPA: T9SS type A sorting domain-containing protein [Chlorobiota bacterium]|nr:T9SS type A sorting domain-containing protein [Chlorobiota bacterium]
MLPTRKIVWYVRALAVLVFFILPFSDLLAQSGLTSILGLQRRDGTVEYHVVSGDRVIRLLNGHCTVTGIGSTSQSVDVDLGMDVTYVAEDKTDIPVRVYISDDYEEDGSFHCERLIVQRNGHDVASFSSSGSTTASMRLQTPETMTVGLRALQSLIGREHKDGEGSVQAGRNTVRPKDPRVFFAQYLERWSAIRALNDGSIVVGGATPFNPYVTVTDSLVDDSVTVRSWRTMRVDTTGRIRWVVYCGPMLAITAGPSSGVNQALVLGNNGDFYNLVQVRTGVNGMKTSGTYRPQPIGGNDMYVSRWTSEGRLEWSTFLGGTADESFPKGVVDAEGNVIVGCYTRSGDIDMVNAAIDKKPNHLTKTDVVLFCLAKDGKSLRWSTYFSSADIFMEHDTDQGGPMFSYAGAHFVDLVQDGGNQTIVGVYQSGMRNPPVTPGAWMTEPKGGIETMIGRFDTDGRLTWCTLVSSKVDDQLYHLARYGDTAVMAVFTLENHTMAAKQNGPDSLPAIGVPGQSWPPKDRKFKNLILNTDGVPRVLWSAFPYGIDIFDVYADGQVRVTPLEENSADAFFDVPAYTNNPGLQEVRTSIARTNGITLEPEFTTSHMRMTVADIRMAGGTYTCRSVIPIDGGVVIDTNWVVVDTMDGLSSYGAAFRLPKRVYTSVAEDKQVHEDIKPVVEVHADALHITAETDIVSITIHDILGRRIVTSSPMQTMATITRSGLTSGIYVVDILLANGQRHGVKVAW